MRNHHCNDITRFYALLVILLAIPLVGYTMQADAAHRPTKGQFSSKWLAITSGGIVGQPGGKPTLLLRFQNKKWKPLWVKVDFRTPEPNQDCGITKRLNPKEGASYFCQLENIVADTDYPIHISIFSDEALTNVVEKTSTKLYFPKQAMATILAAHAPPILPEIFNKVFHTNKPRSGAGSWGTFKKTGTFVINENNVEYIYKGKKIAIPYSNMRSVSVEQLGSLPGHVWLLIGYQSNGEPKSIGFQPHAIKGNPGDLPKMYSTLKYIFGKKGPIEQVRFDFDGRNWSEGHSVETSAQTVKEYVLPGETVKNWTELVTVQTFPGRQADMTARKTMLRTKKITLKDCPDAMWNVITESEEAILYEWRTTDCPGYGSEYEVSKLIRGKMGIHRLAYANRKLPISKDRRNRWIDLIERAKLELVQR